MTIFTDREKLSPRYVPPVLLHRERQLDQLNGFFREGVLNPSKAFFKTIQIIGTVGTGKTSTALRFGENLGKEAKKSGVNLQHVYVNLKLQGGSRVILYRYLLENVAPEVYSPGLSAEEILRVLLKSLAETKRYIIISLDEIDYFLKSTKETGIVYDLTRLNEIDPRRPSNVLGVLFIARGREFHEKLDKAELSTLGRLALEFPPYKSKEIFDILTERTKEAFTQNAVSQEVLSYIADVTSSPPANGDLRYALDLLLYAGNLAENQDSEKILPDHVRRVHGEIHPSITEEDIINLPKKEHLIALLAVARSLRTRKRLYTTLKDIRLNCEVICEEKGIPRIDDLDDYVQDLSDRGLIQIESLKEIGIKGATAGTLEAYLDNLLKRVEAGINR